MNWFRSLFGSKCEFYGRVLSYDEMMSLIEAKRKFRLF